MAAFARTRTAGIRRIATRRRSGLARDVVARGYRAQAGSVWTRVDVARRRRAAPSVEVVAAVRDAVGPDVQIMIEMHGRFSPAAAAMSRRARGHRPSLDRRACPVRQSTGLARCAPRRATDRDRRARPLDCDFRGIIEQGVVDIVQVDLTHFGGFGLQ